MRLHCIMLLSIKSPPGPMRGFDKGVDERPFPQGGTFDMILSDLC